MIKPERLRKGDKVAIVSLSSGMLGEDWAIHKLDIAKERLEKDFGLKVVVMPNALKGIEFLDKHPELRAKDLMDAFKDQSIKAIFNAIGGEDTIRLLPYIDFDIIKNNPKILTGFSDTTTNHFMMYKAGVVSYYGASIMNNFGEYIKINDYTKDAIINTLFEPKQKFEIKPSKTCSYEKDKVWWLPENINTERKYYKNTKGYEVLQASLPGANTKLYSEKSFFIQSSAYALYSSGNSSSDQIRFGQSAIVGRGSGRRNRSNNAIIPSYRSCFLFALLRQRICV